MYSLLQSNQIPYIRIPSYPGSDKGKIRIEVADLDRWIQSIKKNAL